MSDRSRYVQAFRQHVAVPDGSHDRNLAAIERRLAAGEVVDEDDDERSAPVTPRGRWAAALFVFKAVSLSVGLGVAGLGVVKVGAMTWYAAAKDEPQVSAPPEPTHEEKAEPQRRVEAPLVEPAPAPVEAQPAPLPPPAVERAAAKPSRDVKAPVADRLREELDILERARAELEAGRHTAVLDLVADHERRFPDGAMLEERRAWRAIATCSLRRADARGHAESFLDRHPRSSLAEKVRRACADQLTDPKPRAD